MIEMARTGKGFRAEIPPDYTDSPFPLQYHFQSAAAAARDCNPGLQPGWRGQPYFVVRRDKAA